MKPRRKRVTFEGEITTPASAETNPQGFKDKSAKLMFMEQVDYKMEVEEECSSPSNTRVIVKKE